MTQQNRAENNSLEHAGIVKSAKILMLSMHNPKVDPREKWHFDEIVKNGITIDFVGVSKQNKLEEEENSRIIEIKVAPTIRMNYSQIRALKNVDLTNFVVIIILKLVRKIIEFFGLNRVLMAANNSVDLKKILAQQPRLAAKLSKVILKISRKIGFFRSTRLFVAHYLIGLENLYKWLDENISDYLNLKFVIANDWDTVLLALYVRHRKSSVIVIYDAQEYAVDANPGVGVFGRKLIKLIEKKLIRKSDLVLTVSPHLGDYLQKKYDIQKPLVVPNAAPKIEKNYRMPSNLYGNNIVFQGGIYPGRGLEFLLRAWRTSSLLQDFNLFIQGPDSNHRDALIDLAKKLDLLEKSVFFPSAVPVNDMELWLSKYASIGIIPYEGKTINNKYCCPNKISHYMRVGLPIVINAELEFVSSLIEQSKAGVIYTNDDVTSLELAIEELKNSKKKLELSKLGFGFQAQSYYWEKFMTPLIDAYKL